MLISIIIPIYNTATYLSDCLESIVNQTYTNFEAIMINDGSTDESEKVCTEYAEKDSRFILFNIENQGVSAARNFGLEKCNGEIISFVDSDDILEKDFYEEMIECLLKNDADIAQCNFLINNKNEFIDWEDDLFSDNKETMSAFLHGKICNRIMNKIYKRSLICSAQNGGRFPEDRYIMEDAYWTAHVLQQTNRLATMSKGLYHYRIVPSSLSRKRLTENEMNGKYRNVLEKFVIISDTLSDERKLIEDNMLAFSKECLLSFNNLKLHNVYGLLREFLINNPIDNPIATTIIKNDKFEKAQKKVFFRVICSPREKITLKKDALRNFLSNFLFKERKRS